MGPFVRVARFDLGKGRGQVEDLVALDALHGELRQLVRRHLPDVTASVLARPRVAPDGESVEWYSDLAGQPGPLTALPAARRAAIRSKLDARLESLRRLAAALPRKVKGSERIAEALARAARDPDDSLVYVVGDEPVIIRWGDAAPDRIDEAPIQGAAVGEPPRLDAKRTRRVSLLVGLLLRTLAGAGTALWLWLGAQETGQLAAELAAATAAGCDGLDRLDALALRLDRQDPERLDYTELRARIRDWHALCERATALEREIESSGWDSRVSSPA